MFDTILTHTLDFLAACGHFIGVFLLWCCGVASVVTGLLAVATLCYLVFIFYSPNVDYRVEKVKFLLFVFTVTLIVTLGLGLTATDQLQTLAHFLLAGIPDWINNEAIPFLGHYLTAFLGWYDSHTLGEVTKTIFLYCFWGVAGVGGTLLLILIVC